jgi:hypothetical protein
MGRASELAGLPRDDLKLAQSRIWVHRLKNGLATDQPLDGDELRAVKRYLDTRDDRLPWFFINECGGQMTRKGVHYFWSER